MNCVCVCVILLAFIRSLCAHLLLMCQWISIAKNLPKILNKHSATRRPRQHMNSVWMCAANIFSCWFYENKRRIWREDTRASEREREKTNRCGGFESVMRPSTYQQAIKPLTQIFAYNHLLPQWIFKRCVQLLHLCIMFGMCEQRVCVCACVN